MRSFSTCPDGVMCFLRRWRLLFAAIAVACISSCSYAIDGKRAVSQYLIDRWSSEQGMMGGPIYGITQTPDGYLWIGSEKGLLRFDGQTFRDIQPSNASIQPISHILTLVVDRTGVLWMRLRGSGVIRYHDGFFEEVPFNSRQEAGVTAMSLTFNGILLSTLSEGTLKFTGNAMTVLTPPISPLVISIAEATNGTIWFGTRESGLEKLSGGQITSVVKGLPDMKVNCMLPAENGKLWIGTDHGLALWNGREVSTQGIPSSLSHVQVLTMASDRDANLWIGTDRGVLRYNADGAFWLEDNPSQSRSVSAIFEDREGNIWIGDSQGIERVRDSAFNTYSTVQGLPSDSNGPIYADPGGRLWAAPMQGGLFWMRGGEAHRVATAGLDTDIVYSITGSAKDIWLGRQRGGLTRLRIDDEALTAETYTQASGLAQNSVYTVYESRDGTIWAGTLSGGVSHFQDGTFTTYTSADGLASNTISSIVEGLDGTMWFATPSGLSAFSSGKWRIYTMSNGLPSDDVISLTEDAEGVLWVGTATGLANVSAGQVHAIRSLPQHLHEPVFAIADDRAGFLWLATAHHVLRVNRQKLLYGKLGDGDVREYGLADGLRGVEGVRRDRSMTTDPEARIWFSMNRGISVIDPERVGAPSPPAIAHIESVSADENPIEMAKTVQIPPSHQRIAFSYTGLCLAAPERVRFRYRLDGFDHNWSAPVAAHEAVYTNLSPGNYRFRVMASNSTGLWNGPEASIPFFVEPSFWQTWWFQLSCVMALALMAWFLYRLRMQQMLRQVNVRFDERLAERMRIAQELHDTLLQGFLSASMQLHIVADQIPDDSPAKLLLNRILQLMSQVIEEGRSALKGLRSTEATSLNLEQAFSRIPQELAYAHKTGYRVIVGGVSRPLHPMIRDEVYRIGREALVNAFRHAQAASIEIEINYTAGDLRISVRDDGSGIAPQVLLTGREGHWGLPGMRERAERIGAKLKLWSRAAAGTEVELTIPGHIAYEHPTGDGMLGWFRKLSFHKLKAAQEKKRESQK